MTFKMREVAVLPAETVANSGTKTIDVDVTDPITQLLVQFALTNGAATADDVPCESCITKIELVDGGETYWTLPGPVAVAASCFDLGMWPPAWYDERANASQNITIPINFGRYVGDEVYSFLPASLLNPQIKVTYAKNALHLTNTVSIGLLARVMEGAASPQGILAYKEIETFTSVASGDKTISMPVDYPYRRLLIRPYIADNYPYNVLSRYKLDCDIGKFIGFDLSQWKFGEVCQQRFGPYTYHKTDCFDNAGAAQAWMGSDVIVTPNTATAERIAYAATAGSHVYTQRAYNSTWAAQTDLAVDCLIWGFLPQCTFCYPFGLQDNPDKWFDPREFKRIDLKLTQAVADASVIVAVQQPRTLP